MRIKITSDGTIKGTRVVDAVTGEPVENVSRVEWKASVHLQPQAIITVIGVEIDAEGVIPASHSPLHENSRWLGEAQANTITK